MKYSYIVFFNITLFAMQNPQTMYNPQTLKDIASKAFLKRFKKTPKLCISSLNCPQDVQEYLFHRKYYLPRLNYKLYWATKEGLDFLIPHLINQGADINALEQPEPGCYLVESAIHAATSKENVATVQLLLEYGAKIDIPDYFGNSALERASAIGNINLMKLLMSRGANVNGNYGKKVDSLGKYIHDRTPLEQAIKFNNYSKSLKSESVQLLLEAGASPDLPGEAGFTLFELAIALDLTAIAKLLLLYNANPNGYYGRINGLGRSTKNHPLIMAADKGNSEAFQLLLAAGAQLDLKEVIQTLHTSISELSAKEKNAFKPKPQNRWKLVNGRWEKGPTSSQPDQPSK